MTNLKLVAYFVHVRNYQKQQLFGIKRSFVDLQYDFSDSPIIYYKKAYLDDLLDGNSH